MNDESNGRLLRANALAMTMVTLRRPYKRAFLFVLYVIAGNFCHRFIRVGYDSIIIRGDMKSIDTHTHAFVVPPASLPDLKPASRLIVLVPDLDVDFPAFAQKLKELAKAIESRVQLLGLSRDAAHEPGIRRRLVTLSAMMEEKDIFVESTVEIGRDWVDAVKSYWREGDVIVCFAEYRPGFNDKPLAQILERKLAAPIYIISGLYHEPVRTNSSLKKSILGWTGSIALLFGFFVLQVRLMEYPQDLIHSIGLYASILAETASIWFWNNLFT